jgi:hypothetical protein
MKKTPLPALGTYLLLAGLLAAACAKEANTVEPDDTSGGTSATGGSKSTSGSANKSGASAFGGTTGTGGKPGTGGATDGGNSAAGGTAGATAGGKGGAGGSSGSGGGGVSPDVLQRASVIVYYETNQATASTGTIAMKLFVENKSADPLPMASVKIRYWLTAEVSTELHQYYTGPQAQQPKAVFVEDGANSHVLMTFGAGSIVKGGDLNASEVQLAITNNTGKFDQADDFSWLPTAIAKTPNDKVTLYLADKLIWGCEPSGNCFDDDTGAGGAGGAGGADAGAPAVGGAGGAE